jgi:putative ABC transport system ATP-binding protein
MIRIEKLSRHYQMGPTTVRAIDEIDLSIQEGEFVSIIGPSGSGKSTLMNIIGCLDSPTSGHYRLAGEEVEGLDKNRLAEIRNRYIGFVFQNFNLLPRVSAVENVELPLIYAGVPPRKRREKALEMLSKVKLEAREHHIPNELSGGQRQRVAIARALVSQPKVLLADEPTGALDTKTGQQIMQLFRDLNRENVTLIMVTHDPDVARQARRIVQIRDGKILADVPIEEWNS